MHKYEKIWLTFGTSALVIFLVILGISAVHQGHSPAASGIETINPEHVRDDARFKEPGLYEAESDEYDYELYFVASAFQYEPREVEIPKGSRVRIHVTTPDVIHGFEIAHTNVNMMVEPGLISKYTANFNKEGEFLIICNEYCGVGHTDMTSLIKVTGGEE
ncbi:cytochrome c oxidase subunit 2 [Phocicoccus schoeneichii]|uniref:Cytochrome aa3 subunit 2 n=1 Tax=Phocicoccus schoeneichii TaxID=1812261 RepID=A0A6V7RHA0_9BACL|nr:cytochrome c oxidase subunit II [Jeotgalicoccus schoeneichii]GGH48591.1 cytochrome c oxidase subunit 2 [Jeotgalicoccus schoeneichii]CAD2076695.1 Cytochrome c oxidase subunit 2 [Jeotgalicoccus schoeneichii]